MRRTLLAAVVCVSAVAPTTAQDQRPAVARPALAPLAAAERAAQLEEEVEVLEAEREIKKAHIRVAESGVKVVEIETARVKRHIASGVGSKEDLDRANLATESAKARLDVCTAELKLVDVRLKFARKRLNDAKAAGERLR